MYMRDMKSTGELGQKKCCIGVTRPTLKFAPTLNFFFLWKKRKNQEKIRTKKKYRKNHNIGARRSSFKRNFNFNFKYFFSSILSLLFLHASYFQIETGSIIFDICTALRTQATTTKNLKKKIRPTDPIFQPSVTPIQQFFFLA